MNLVSADTIGPQHPKYTKPRPDHRPAIRHLSPEMIDRCIIDAARSTSILGIHGSACAELVEYEATCYAEIIRPDGSIINPGEN